MPESKVIEIIFGNFIREFKKDLKKFVKKWENENVFDKTSVYITTRNRWINPATEESKNTLLWRYWKGLEKSDFIIEENDKEINKQLEIFLIGKDEEDLSPPEIFYGDSVSSLSSTPSKNVSIINIEEYFKKYKENWEKSVFKEILKKFLNKIITDGRIIEKFSHLSKQNNKNDEKNPFNKILEEIIDKENLKLNFIQFCSLLDYYYLFKDYDYTIVLGLLIGGYHILTIYINLKFKKSIIELSSTSKFDLEKEFKIINIKKIFEVLKIQSQAAPLSFSEIISKTSELPELSSFFFFLNQKLQDYSTLFAMRLFSILSEEFRGIPEEEDFIKKVFSHIFLLPENCIIIGNSKNNSYPQIKISSQAPISERNFTIQIPTPKPKITSNEKTFIQTFAANLLKEALSEFELVILPANRALLKVTVGEIMSRNLSHNIGSHALTEMGAYGITENNNILIKNFYRYLQHRMDFIAQITTEIPGWSYSAWFHKEIMREFYNQFVLLDRLNISEGLRAYDWPDEGWKTASTRGKLIIRTATQQNGETRWIFDEFYKDKGDDDHRKNNQSSQQEGESEGKGEESETSAQRKYGDISHDDFQVAVPGGSVGFHAFYVIFEDFIRNEAKHAYVKIRKELKERIQGSMQKNKKILFLVDKPSDLESRINNIIEDIESKLNKKMENLKKNLSEAKEKTKKSQENLNKTSHETENKILEILKEICKSLSEIERLKREKQQLESLLKKIENEKLEVLREKSDWLNENKKELVSLKKELEILRKIKKIKNGIDIIECSTSSIQFNKYAAIIISCHCAIETQEKANECKNNEGKLNLPEELPDNIPIFACVKDLKEAEEYLSKGLPWSHLLSPKDWDALLCFLELGDIDAFIDHLTALPLRINIKIEEDKKNPEILWVTIWSDLERKLPTIVLAEDPDYIIKPKKEIYWKIEERTEKIGEEEIKNIKGNVDVFLISLTDKMKKENSRNYYTDFAMKQKLEISKIIEIEKGLGENLLNTQKASTFVDVLKSAGKDLRIALPVPTLLNIILEKSLLTRDGKIREKNWGLAEVKFSALFLQQRDILDLRHEGEHLREKGKSYITAIGDRGNNSPPRGIIKAVFVNENGKEKESLNKNGKYYLGFKFWVRRPKEVMYVNGGGKKGKVEEEKGKSEETSEEKGGE